MGPIDTAAAGGTFPLMGELNRTGMACFAGVDFDRGRLFSTADADEAREVCGRVFNPHRLDVVRPAQALAARMDHLPLGPMSLNRLTWGAHVRVDPDRLASYYLISIPVRGAARFHIGAQDVEVSPTRACVISAPQRFRFEADAQFDQIVLRLEKPDVDAAWTALTGRAPEHPIELEGPLPLAGSTWRAMEPTLRVIGACAAGAYAGQAEAHVHQRVHDMLLTTMLLHLAPAWAQRRPGPVRASAALARRAQSYLLERLDAPLTLGMVARATGVATRTLQAAFQAECGIGPMQWLRQQRLEAVHGALLEASSPAATVTDIAFAFGFSHMGEFARAYRARFGESPGRTLARRH